MKHVWRRLFAAGEVRDRCGQADATRQARCPNVNLKNPQAKCYKIQTPLPTQTHVRSKQTCKSTKMTAILALRTPSLLLLVLSVFLAITTAAPLTRRTSYLPYGSCIGTANDLDVGSESYAEPTGNYFHSVDGDLHVSINSPS